MSISKIATTILRTPRIYVLRMACIFTLSVAHAEQYDQPLPNNTMVNQSMNEKQSQLAKRKTELSKKLVQLITVKSGDITRERFELAFGPLPFRRELVQKDVEMEVLVKGRDFDIDVQLIPLPSGGIATFIIASDCVSGQSEDQGCLSFKEFSSLLLANGWRLKNQNTFQITFNEYWYGDKKAILSYRSDRVVQIVISKKTEE